MPKVEEKQMAIWCAQKQALTVILNLIILRLDFPKLY